MQNGQQMIEMKQQKPLGTQIFDRNLPSNIDFEPQSLVLETQKRQKQANDQSKNYLFLIGPDIKSFMIKGKAILSPQPLYKKGDILKNNPTTFSVRCYDDQRNSGIKGMWQALIGYCYRQLYISQGYVYLLNRQKEGLQVFNLQKLKNIFKIFLVWQDEVLRFIFVQEGTGKLVTKDYGSTQIKNIMDKLQEQMNSIGLALVG